jgi:hypothetical protein
MPKDVTGIARGRTGVPEEAGIFLSEGDDVPEASFFIGMGSGREIDVWEVDVSGLPLEPGPDGWLLCRMEIEPCRVRLVETWATGTAPFDPGSRVFSADD